MERFEFDHAGKVALVTGASSGLGRRFAEVLAAQGVHVAIAARRIDRLNEIAAGLRETGVKVLPVELDMTRPGTFADTVARIEAELGPVSILVNNAGVSKQVPFLDVDEAFFDRIVSTNVKGTYLLTQAVARRMVAQGTPGRIVNIASSSALRAKARLSVYGLSKAAVVHMTRTLATELGASGIGVNCICPGYILTEMSANFADSPAGQKMIAALPRGRAGDVSDLDGLLLLLTSERACNFINGAVVSADDGFAAT